MLIKDKFKAISISLIVSSILIGCGSSNSSNETTTKTLSGIAIDPEIQGATVFLDLNENGILDEGEQYTITDENGLFNLNISSENFGKPIIVQGGVDKVTKEDFTGQLSVLPQSTQNINITPLTSLVYQSKKADTSNKSIEEIKNELTSKLGLSNSNQLDANTLDEENKELLQISLQLHKVSTFIANNSEDNNSISDIYSQISQELLSKNIDLDKAISDTIEKQLTVNSLAYNKAQDLNYELKSIEVAAISPEALALTVNNIQNQIVKTNTKEELEKNLFNIDEIIIDNTEVEVTMAQNALCRIGYGNLDQEIQNQIITSDKINFNTLSLASIKELIENNSIGLDENTFNQLNIEKMINESGLNNLTIEDKKIIKEEFSKVDFNATTSTIEDFKEKLTTEVLINNQDLQDNIINIQFDNKSDDDNNTDNNTTENNETIQLPNIQGGM